MKIKTTQLNTKLGLRGLISACLVMLAILISGIALVSPVSAAPAQDPPAPTANNDTDADTSKGKQCGKGENKVKTKFDFGCLGDDYKGDELNPINDLAWSFVRFLSTGVGIVIAGSIILAGIQYSSSEGNPEATQAAKNRIQSAFVGLIVYIFAYSFLQYLVPGGVFNA